MAGDMALIRRQVDDENWLNVAKAGANGIVLALVSLSWWSLGAKGDSDRQWCSDAVDDVAWVLKQLVRRFTKPEEEVDDIDEEGAHRGRKRYVYNSRISQCDRSNIFSQSTTCIVWLILDTYPYTCLTGHDDQYKCLLYILSDTAHDHRS